MYKTAWNIIDARLTHLLGTGFKPSSLFLQAASKLSIRKHALTLLKTPTKNSNISHNLWRQIEAFHY